MSRDGSRTAATSKMKHFVIIVNGWKPLTIITNLSILDVTAVLDPLLMSSFVHIDNKGKDILILGEGPTQGLDDTTLTAEAIYPIKFAQPNKRFILSPHYNGSNSFLYINATKIYQFKAKD